MNLQEMINDFSPSCEQELHDKRLMLNYIHLFGDILSRNNETVHFTASAWIVNPSRTKVLMIYHNIYNSWSWTGGHADGDENLLRVALREVQEETGLNLLTPVSELPISLEILPVCAHFRKGKYVAPHLHLNLTYLLEADENLPIRCNPAENSAVAWFTPEDAVTASTEPDMQVIYKKLNNWIKLKI